MEIKLHIIQLLKKSEVIDAENGVTMYTVCISICVTDTYQVFVIVKGMNKQCLYTSQLQVLNSCSHMCAHSYIHFCKIRTKYLIKLILSAFFFKEL